MATNCSTNESTAGIQVLTSAGVRNGRTITGTANQISVTNGDGTGGNPTLALTSTIQVSGISFDSGSNTLSIFSEGTWTVGLQGSSTAGSPQIVGQNGRYQKVGNYAFVNGLLIWGTVGSATGNWQLTGLPFTSETSSSQHYSCAANYGVDTKAFASGSGSIPSMLVNSNTTISDIDTYSESGGSRSAIAVAANGSLAFQVTYKTA